MKIFITGTDTNVGKTVVSSWLCLQTGYDYFKPIQTGEERDSTLVKQYSNAYTHPEVFSYRMPASPHQAAAAEQEVINTQRIQLPQSRRLIVEGAGGVLVPISPKIVMVDLMQQLMLPVILVTSARLGMINHTLLSLEALYARHLEVLGVIVTGNEYQESCRAIEEYGGAQILAQLPWMPEINQASLSQIPLGLKLTSLL